MTHEFCNETRKIKWIGSGTTPLEATTDIVKLIGEEAFSKLEKIQLSGRDYLSSGDKYYFIISSSNIVEH